MTIDQASEITQMNVQSQVSVAVAKKALDAQRQEGNAALSLIRAASEIGRNEFGGRLDVRA